MGKRIYFEQTDENTENLQEHSKTSKFFFSFTKLVLFMLLKTEEDFHNQYTVQLKKLQGKLTNNKCHAFILTLVIPSAENTALRMAAAAQPSGLRNIP